MPGEGLRYHTTPDLPFSRVNYMTGKIMPRYHRKKHARLRRMSSQTGGFQSEQKWTKIQIIIWFAQVGRHNPRRCRNKNTEHVSIFFCLFSENVILGLGDRSLLLRLRCLIIPMDLSFAVPEATVPIAPKLFG